MSHIIGQKKKREGKEKRKPSKSLAIKVLFLNNLKLSTQSQEFGYESTSQAQT